MNADKIKEFIEVMSKTRKLIFEIESPTSDKRTTTTLQLRGLMVIDHLPGSTVGELANRFMMSSASIAQYLNRLVNSGLLEKRTDKKDKRINRIYLTKLGERELKKVKKIYFDKISQLLQPLTEEELTSMLAIHKKLLSHLENSMDAKA